MLRLLLLLVAFSLASCASSRSRDPEKVNDVMITFVQRAQAGFWKEAMENITPEEREDMMEGNQVMQEYKDAVNRIRLSTIKNMELGLDGRGRLFGVKEILDESNNMYRASEEKIAVDPSKLEDLSVKRIKAEEEAKKRFQENPPVEEKSEWDIYYSKPGGSKPENEDPEPEEE
ncbi:MAG: hypothetical protein LBQ76_07630 [Candidatus Fibromonas sp.]|nr:hypothetical protein [Candidatus Fibromonas sp.]